MTRHHKRGKLLPRERIELLLDADSPFLELSPVAAYGTDFPVGASVVTGIGVVEGVECLVIANDPTVRGGAVNPWSLAKTRRAGEIALANRLPMVNLVESAGADLPTQAEIFIPGGRVFRDLTRLSAEKIPTVSVVFGNATAGGAYVPGMSDHTIMIRDRSQVYLAGPPLVKMATGEDAEDESLGGAAMHASTSGLADFLAADERDGIRLARQCVRRLNWRKHGPGAAQPRARSHRGTTRRSCSASPAPTSRCRSTRARCSPGCSTAASSTSSSRRTAVRWSPAGASCTATRSASSPTPGACCSARRRRRRRSSSSSPTPSDTPLIFLQNTTGYMVGTEYEQRGIIKHGALMINAVSNSTVPHLTVNLGASYGAGNYGMCGRAYEPRFLFTWPNAKSAVMGPAQLAGVLSIVARQAAAARGREFDEDSDAAMRMMVEQQIESQSGALFLSGRLYDDGVIDPRDTRTVLGLCLSAIHNGPVKGADGFGVFRM